METKWEKARADSPELFKRSLSLEEAAQRTASPWDEASGLARLSFWFVRPLLCAWSRREPSADDLPSVPCRDEPAVVAKRVARAWRREVARARKRREDRARAAHAGADENRPEEDASLLRALGACFAPELADLGWWMALEYGCLFAQAALGAARESDVPDVKGSDLGHVPLVSADFWTSDHLSERSRSVDVFSVTRARGTFTLKRRRITLVPRRPRSSVRSSSGSRGRTGRPTRASSWARRSRSRPSSRA